MGSRKPTKDDKISLRMEQVFKRHTNILMEKMDYTVKTVTEQHGSFVKRLDGIESELGSVKAAVMDNSLQIKVLKTDVGTLKSDVGTLKSDVGTLKSDVGTLKSDVGTLKSDVRELKTGQNEIRQKLDIVMANHEQRIGALEEKTHTI